MKMLKKKSVIFASMFLFAFLFSMVPVMGATGTVSLDLPTDAGSVTGTFVLNVTNITGLFDEIVNCTFTIASSLTANTSVTIGTFDNDTIFNVNATFDSTSLEDSDDYLVTASCRNLSSDEATDTATITVDNTHPNTPTLSPADLTTRTTAGTQTFTGTVVDENTTSCTYTIYRGGSPSDGNSGSGTYLTTSCTFTKTFSTSADNGVWWWAVTASDETNTTLSSTYKYTVNIPGSGGGSQPLTIGDKGFFKEGNGWKWVIGIIIILGVAGVIYLFSVESK